jgi:hypothetical protein
VKSADFFLLTNRSLNLLIPLDARRRTRGGEREKSGESESNIVDLQGAIEIYV